jgi:gluconolactonase
MTFVRSRATGLLIPNGTPVDYECGRIERVNLSTGKFERVVDTFDGNKLRGPNDLVFDASGGFWFTDHGKTYARHRDFGGVYYAAADGSTIREVVHPLFTANGIGLSPDNQTLYVADTESARVFAFDVTEPGVLRKERFPAPHGGRLLAAPGGAMMWFDSLAVDALGQVNVATLSHGGITVISPDGASISHVPLPDAFTTNICFGGPDMRTAYITLSGTGKLIAVEDWPTPGLRLNHAM